MEKTSLLSGGKHYDLLVNWEKRLTLEIPFLAGFLSNFQPSIKTILEVGCGTGRHAEILYKNFGFYITGIDIEQTMIEEAKRRLPEAELLSHDFLDKKVLNNRSFDAIISLGNSIGLIAANSNFEEIINRFSQLLKKPGLLIFHLLNTSKERHGWSVPRSIITPDGEFIFLRGFSTSIDFIHPEILTLYRPQNEKKWEMTSTGKASIPRINNKEMSYLLKKYNFNKIRVFGDYHRTSFSSSNSIDMIYVCETK